MEKQRNIHAALNIEFVSKAFAGCRVYKLTTTDRPTITTTKKNWSCCQWVCMSFHYFPNGYDDVSFNAYMKSRMWTSDDNVNGIYG